MEGTAGQLDPADAIFGHAHMTGGYSVAHDRRLATPSGVVMSNVMRRARARHYISDLLGCVGKMKAHEGETRRRGGLTLKRDFVCIILYLHIERNLRVMCLLGG